MSRGVGRERERERGWPGGADRLCSFRLHSHLFKLLHYWLSFATPVAARARCAATPSSISNIHRHRGCILQRAHLPRTRNRNPFNLLFADSMPCPIQRTDDFMARLKRETRCMKLWCFFFFFEGEGERVVIDILSILWIQYAIARDSVCTIDILALVV